MRTKAPSGPRPALLAGLIGAAILALTAAGCAPGAIKRRPPLHPNPNMDDLNHDGQRFDPQEANAFFADGRAMRPPVAGTVARGSLAADDHLYRGQLADGSWAATLPAGLELDHDFLARGQERYGIYCTPCHGMSGAGDGPVPQRGFYPPPTFHDPALRAREIGYFYEVIANGVRNMPAYGRRVPVEDRWAIAAYVRALQNSQGAELDSVPPAIRRDRGW